MKPDGVSMETTEPAQGAAVAEPSSLQENATEQAQSQPEAPPNDAARGASQKANGKKQAVVHSKTQSSTSSGVSGVSSRPGTASLRTVNNPKPSAAGLASKKTTTMTTSKLSAAGAVPKRPMGVAAASSTAKNQTRVPDRRPVGPARTTLAPTATVTNGTKPTAVNGAPKKTPSIETVNNKAKPKTTASTGRVVTSSVPTKTSTSTTAKPTGAATSKTTRPATAPSTSRMTTTTSKPTTATVKPFTTATTKTSTSRVATAPSTGRTTATQPPKPAAAAAAAPKKDVGRPPSTAVAKKPPPATASHITKKHENTKLVTTMRLNSASKGSTPTKAVEAKVSQSKTPQPGKSTPIKKPVTGAQFPLTNKLPLGQTPPAKKPANGSTPNAKRGTKPTQTVPPFSNTKKMEVSKAVTPTVEARSTAGTAGAVAAAASEAVRPPEMQAEATVALPQESSVAASAPEGVSTSGSAQHTSEVEQQDTQTNEVTPSTPKSPARTDLPQTSLKEQLQDGDPLLTQEQMSSPAKALPPMAFPFALPEEAVDLAKDKTPSTSTAPPAAANAIPLILPPTNLNEDEDEEEREGSQLVSVSEMSGTTQPTEESRPGSGGPLGGSAWRAGGALLSELDSEEVSGSQQGASELSAPGVLEGTESMDDLGDGSLKGAMDMEGASVGSPDFEKVPDIPVNDFDDEDDSDRVCDMDVGSERTDEPHRPRHDNDVDEEEEEEDDDDDDVEMVSEGVTESGLESYGNADEDDFAEDERLENLNRVVQPPPPPPQLPSAPAAQWDQPNPFADPWAELLQPGQVAGEAAANTWQVDSETPTQTPPQAWLEPASDAETQNAEARTPHCAPGTSQSSKNFGDISQDGKIPPRVPSPQPDMDCQGLGIQSQQGDEELEEEAEPDTLPADEVLGGPATAPTSNPSSSSETEDEASDTEGEAQLEESVETPAANVTFESQPPAQRCLSIVDEADEAEVEGGVVEDTTPPSAASFASYGLDTATTASTSNAQSTGEGCIKSPGIFSLEELPEEAKQPQTEQCPAEPQYIECGKQETDSAEHVGEEVFTSEEVLDPSSALSTMQQPEEIANDIQPPYYSAICEKTEDSFAGFTTSLHPQRRDHPVYARTCYDIIKPHGATVTPPKLTCADLPPRNPGQQALSPQLRRLEQHQKQLLELQQRREQQSKPLEEAEQERKRRVEEEERKKKEEAEEELKRNKEERKRKEEELKQRRDLELQLQQQQEELKQRQQIMQWQQELQQSNKGQTVLLSPSSGLCTIYEALENSDEEAEDEENEQHSKNKKEPKQHAYQQICDGHKKMESDDSSLLLPDPPDSTQSSSNPSQDQDVSFYHPESPERPPPLDLDWGKKVDIVQQLINQTLLLNGDGCSSLLLLPGGAGGTLSPLESSLWPSLLPPLTPPSATVTSVSSFSPEATGSSPQGEWTVVELETHH